MENAGFSILEVLIALTIISVVSILAAPFLYDVMARKENAVVIGRNFINREWIRARLNGEALVLFVERDHLWTTNGEYRLDPTVGAYLVLVNEAGHKLIPQRLVFYPDGTRGNGRIEMISTKATSVLLDFF